MGIYDRDYYRDPPRRGGFGDFSALSVTTWLIVINVVVFFLDIFLHKRELQRLAEDPQGLYLLYLKSRFPFGPLERWGAFSVDTAIAGGQVWRFVSYQFLHANFQHLLFNMIGLYFFGPIVESYLGARRYVGYYLLCGCAGAVCYAGLHFVGVLVGPSNVPLVGASAAIFGVLVAGAVIAPDVTIVLLFPPVPVQLKYLAMFMVALAAYSALGNGRNAGGEAAHLGGAVLGYVLIRYSFAFNPFAPPRGSGRRVGRVRRRVRFTDWSKDMNR